MKRVRMFLRLTSWRRVRVTCSEAQSVHNFV